MTNTDLYSATGPRYADRNYCTDPWEEIKPYVVGVVAFLAVPALSLLVFLRPKLGYRVVKPWIIAAAFTSMMSMSIFMNAGIFAFTYLRDNWLRSSFDSMFWIPPQTTYPTLPEQGFDAPTPKNYPQMRTVEQREWINTHRITDPKKFQEQRDMLTAELARRKKETEAIQKQAYDKLHAPYRPHLSLLVFSFASLILGIIRRRQALALLSQGWHTMSRGESYLARLFPGVSEFKVQAFVEPALLILIAIPYAWVAISFSLWLIAAAISVMLTEVLVMDMTISRVLDQYDHEVEMHQMQQARQLLKSRVSEQRVADTKGIPAAVFADEIQSLLALTAPNDKAAAASS